MSNYTYYAKESTKFTELAKISEFVIRGLNKTKTMKSHTPDFVNFWQELFKAIVKHEQLHALRRNSTKFI